VLWWIHFYYDYQNCVYKLFRRWVHNGITWNPLLSSISDTDNLSPVAIVCPSHVGGIYQWVFVFLQIPCQPNSSLRLCCPVKNKPQRIHDGKQYSTSPKSHLSCLVTQALHGKPSANHTACEEQKQEEIFRYPTPTMTTIPRPALTINSTAVCSISSSTEPPGKDFVKSVNRCNEDIPTEKYFPKSKTAKNHPVCRTMFRSSNMRSCNAYLPIFGGTSNRDEWINHQSSIIY